MIYENLAITFTDSTNVAIGNTTAVQKSQPLSWVHVTKKGRSNQIKVNRDLWEAPENSGPGSTQKGYKNMGVLESESDKI